MPNGDNDTLWRELHGLETRLLGTVSEIRSDISTLKAELRAHEEDMEHRWSGLAQRQSSIPTWVMIAITVAMTFVMNIINWMIQNGP